MMTTRVLRLTTSVISPTGILAKPTWGKAPPTERRPIGGNLQAWAMACACSGVATSGTTTPMAPPSSTRVEWKCWCAGTRTSGVTFRPRAASEICVAPSTLIALCSMSMNSQSKPTSSAMIGRSAVRAWRTPRPSASSPAWSRCNAWFSKIGMTVLPRGCGERLPAKLT